MQGLSFVGLLELFNYHTFVFFNLTKNILGVPLFTKTTWLIEEFIYIVQTWRF